MAYQENLSELLKDVPTYEFARDKKVCLMWYNSKSGVIYSFLEPPVLQFRYTTRAILECIDSKPLGRVVELESGTWSYGLDKALEQISEFNQDQALMIYDTVRVLPKRSTVSFGYEEETNVVPVEVMPYPKLKEKPSEEDE